METMVETNLLRDEGVDRIERARRALRSLVAPDPEERAALRHGLFAEDFVIEVPARGGCQVYSSLERGEFRSGSIDVVEAIESGNRVIAQVRLEADRCYRNAGEPATQHCTADGIVTFEFDGDRIAKSWSMLRWR